MDLEQQINNERNSLIMSKLTEEQLFEIALLNRSFRRLARKTTDVVEIAQTQLEKYNGGYNVQISLQGESFEKNEHVINESNIPDEIIERNYNHESVIENEVLYLPLIGHDDLSKSMESHSTNGSNQCLGIMVVKNPKESDLLFFQSYADNVAWGIHHGQKAAHDNYVTDLFRKAIRIIAHDLRTPLTIIQGMSEILLIKVRSAEKIEEKHVELIYRSATKLSKMTGDYLDLERIEAGQKLDTTEVDLYHQIIQPALEYSNLIIETRNLEISSGLEQQIEGTIVKADMNEMGKVFANIFSNFKYAQKNSKIDINLEESDSTYTLTINNQTPYKLTQEDIGHLTKEFYRPKSVDSENGSGLGMHIMDSIIREHGWKMDIEVSPSSIGVQNYTLSLTIPKK